MITRDMVIDEILTWLGTPYHHLGRAKGVGVDCAGLIIGVAHALGISCEFDVGNYSPLPDSKMMKGHLDNYLERIELKDARSGDILFMRFMSEPQHLAFVCEYEEGIKTIIHSFAQVRKCVKHHYDVDWKKRTICAYKFKGVS